MKDMKNKPPVWVKALLDQKLSATDYRVFQYLRWRQGQNGHSWPSQNTIATELQLSDRAIRNITKRLEEKGYIQIKRPDIQGRGNPLQYSIAKEPKGGTQVPPLSASKGGTVVPPSNAKRRNVGSKKGGTQVPTNTSHITQVNKKSDLHLKIFNHWNGYKGCSIWKQNKKVTWHSHQHRTDGSISPEITKAIKQALGGGHLPEEIKAAIDNYAKVLLGEDYVWSYVWPLSTFLTVKHEKHKNADHKWWQFLPDNFIEENYLTEAAKRRRANKQAGPNVIELVKAGRISGQKNEKTETA